MSTPDIEVDANRLLKKVRRARGAPGKKRPILVEVCGTSKSGKSTIREMLYTFFRRAGFSVHTLPEAAGTIEVGRKNQYFYTLRAGAYNLSNLLDRAEDPRYDIVIFERSIFDHLCWWTLIHKEGLIDDKTLLKMQAFYSQPGITDLLDAVVFLTCDPETALKREPTLVQKTGARMNPKTQLVLTEAFMETARVFGPSFKTFRHFDNSGDDHVERHPVRSLDS
ncbi:MAG: hypothetical protein AAB617_00170 [Patescibacteria group bacterium]